MKSGFCTYKFELLADVMTIIKKVKSSRPLVGYTAGAYPCFNDMKFSVPLARAGTHLQLSGLKL